jgi:hypothetical protein
MVDDGMAMISFFGASPLQDNFTTIFFQGVDLAKFGDFCKVSPNLFPELTLQKSPEFCKVDKKNWVHL